MQHALAQEEEKELWRLLDAHGRGSVNLDTFKARYRAWPKSTHAGVGRGGRDTGGGGGAGNAKAAGAFVKDQAWRRCARCTSCLTPLTSVSLSASHSPPSLFSHSIFLLYEQPECIVRTLRTYNLKASCQHARAHMHTHNCMSKMETGSYQPKTSISSTSVPRRIRAGSVASDHGPLSSATLRCTSRVQISR